MPTDFKNGRDFFDWLKLGTAITLTPAVAGVGIAANGIIHISLISFGAAFGLAAFGATATLFTVGGVIYVKFIREDGEEAIIQATEGVDQLNDVKDALGGDVTVENPASETETDTSDSSEGESNLKKYLALGAVLVGAVAICGAVYYFIKNKKGKDVVVKAEDREVRLLTERLNIPEIPEVPERELVPALAAVVADLSAGPEARVHTADSVRRVVDVEGTLIRREVDHAKEGGRSTAFVDAIAVSDSDSDSFESWFANLGGDSGSQTPDAPIQDTEDEDSESKKKRGGCCGPLLFGAAGVAALGALICANPFSTDPCDTNLTHSTWEVGVDGLRAHSVLAKMLPGVKVNGSQVETDDYVITPDAAEGISFGQTAWLGEGAELCVDGEVIAELK